MDMLDPEEVVLQLRERLGRGHGLVASIVADAEPTPAEQSDDLLRMYEDRTSSLRATLRAAYGEPLPPAHERRCGFDLHDLIPPCGLSHVHGSAGSTFFFVFQVWDADDVWIIAAGCFSQHSDFSHCTISLGLARHPLADAGALSA